jgi:hypothetical protein
MISCMTNESRLRSRSATLALCAFLTLAARPLTADTPPLIDCPWAGSVSDSFGAQAFYVPRYPGNSLGKVTLYVQARATGTYVFSLTARAGSFAGAILGTSTATVTIAATSVFVPVDFVFASPAITPLTPVTFQGAVVTNPGGLVFFAVQTPSACPVIETVGTSAPLDTYRRLGIAVRIEGSADNSFIFAQTTTVPSVASIHGLNASFFHTDLWLFNRDSQATTVSARFRCLTGLACSSAAATFSMEGFSARTITDVIPTLFGLSETAGALELTTTEGTPNALYTLSRTYSPALPAPTAGASLVALPASAANGDAVFLGIAGSGGNLSTGFRTNVGVYNPQEIAASVTFTLKTSGGTAIGSTSLDLAPHEARQLNDIFASVGQGGVVATDAVLSVTSDLPIFSFTTVIDNRTGDFVYQGTTNFF